uniref:Uncharacterized protein n=1 Tax=Solanum tuberosum TaxID=4113 RepID=M1DXZ6_SOLTU
MGDNNDEISLTDVVVAQPAAADKNELIMQLMQQIAEMRIEMLRRQDLPNPGFASNAPADVYKIASSLSYFSIKRIWRSQKGEELPKIDNFSVDAGKILVSTIGNFPNPSDNTPRALKIMSVENQRRETQKLPSLGKRNPSPTSRAALTLSLMPMTSSVRRPFENEPGVAILLLLCPSPRNQMAAISLSVENSTSYSFQL